MEKSLAGAVKHGKMDQAKRDEVLARITFTPDLKDVASADIVIEAVPEILDLKVSLIKELDELVSPDNVIATNTSSIPIAELAGKVRHPGRVVGVHFFSPVPLMKLVEVVVALDTDPETADTAFAFAQKLGKHPIRTKDRSGFIVNFLLIGYVNAAIRMYEEGFASREDIDDGMRLGAGHPMGPLTLADMIGLDIVCSVGNSLYEEFKRDEYAPPPLLRRMIAAGAGPEVRTRLLRVRLVTPPSAVRRPWSPSRGRRTVVTGTYLPVNFALPGPLVTKLSMPSF